MAIVDVRKMTPEEKEAFHREAETRIQPLAYAAPDSGKPKDVLMLGKTGRMRTLVQIVKSGGENNLHYHTNSDTTWMVLKGRVRFYGLGDTLIGEYGPGEGILMPGGARYWFEKAGDDDLELLQVVAAETGAKAERINVEAHKDWMKAEPLLTVYE
jgi:mannose-6-phosphate isomerase-like protein (cupin superfamily)